MQKTILHTVCQLGDFETAQCFISQTNFDFSSKDIDDKNILHYSCQSGNLDLVKCLISLDKIDINIRDKELKTVLHSACDLHGIKGGRSELSRETSPLNIAKRFFYKH